MKKITFKKLYIKNFLSVGEDPIDLKFNTGFNIITGLNKDEDDIRNGVGKSTICEAFYYAIFGTTMRDLTNQNFIINRKTGKNCKVRLEFDNNSSKHGQETFIIERTLAPKSLKIWKNGEEKTKSTIPETNKYIKEVLSLNEELFQNCIIMRANNTVPFMVKKKTDKKNFIESIFSLSVFSDMSKLMREDLRNAKREYDILETSKLGLYQNKEKYEAELARLKQEEAEKFERIKQQNERLEADIKSEKDKLLALQERNIQVDPSVLSSLESTQAEQQAKQQQFYSIRAKIDANSELKVKELNKIVALGNVCPTCKREYGEDVQENMKLEKQKLTNEIEQLKKDKVEAVKYIRVIEEKLAEIQNSIKEYNNKVNQICLISQEIAACNRTIQIYSEQQKSLLTNSNNKNTSIASFEKLLNDTNDDILVKESETTEIEKTLGKLNICEYILGDCGVRAYIVNKLLELLNNRIKFYLKSFKSTFDFSFNEYFEEEIKDVNGIICLYNNCSGAEMKKIDLAISFAFLDIIKFQQQIEYNISFFDEILDSSVDSKSLEIIVNFISEQAFKNNKAVYIITHKQDIVLPERTQTIMLEKIDGFTHQIEA